MRSGIAAVAAAGLLLAAASTAAAYRTGAPAAHTGGFGEPHCGACHFNGAAADRPGTAAIEAPAAWTPGRTYDITISVEDPDLAAAGFQLAVRFTESDHAGRQAGQLEPADERTQVSTAADGVAYAGHSEAGTTVQERGRAAWTLRWTAPDTAAPVIFHVAANAANDDDSEFGDRIYRAERTAQPDVK